MGTDGTGTDVRSVRALFSAAQAAFVADDTARGVDTRRTRYAEITALHSEAARVTPAVVVVGAVGQGKSTLVNALLDMPDASPTGPGETTGVYLVFQAADAQTPAGTAQLEMSDGSIRSVERSELAAHVVVGSTSADESLIGARVALDAPPFGGTTVIDTPGVGGLSPAHARLAFSRARRASVLLMVVDAGGVLTRPALEFLEECSDHVASVVLVVSKIDRTPAWQQIVESDRAVLRTSTRRRLHDVPIVGVCAQARLDAATVPAQAAPRLIEFSGFDGLTAIVEQRLGLGDRLLQANALQQLGSELSSLARSIAADIAAQSGEEGRAQTQAALDRFTERRRQAAAWRTDLDNRLALATLEIRRGLRERLRAFVDRWQQEFDRHAFGLRKQASSELSGRMQAELVALVEDLRLFGQQSLETAVAGTVAKLELDEIEVSRLIGRLQDDGVDAMALRDARATPGVAAVMAGITGLRAGAYAGGGQALVGAFGVGGGLVAGLGFGAVAGAGLVALNLLMQGAIARKTALQTHLKTVVSELGGESGDEFQRAVLEMKPSLVAAIDDALRRALAELQQRKDEAERLAHAGDLDRAATVKALRERMAAAQSGADEADRLLTALLIEH